jgi:hypothetical protein
MWSNSTLYRTWYCRLLQLSPDGCANRLKNMLLLVVGMYKAGSVHLSLIARKMPIRAKKLSLDKRLRRLLSNGAIDVRAWYEPVARHLLRVAAVAGEVTLIIDCTKVAAGHQLLMVAVAFRHRALPLAWTWVRCRNGHSRTSKQAALLHYVRQLMPLRTKVMLVGDTEFGNTRLLKQLEAWRWYYVLRQSGAFRFQLKQDRHSRRWYRFDRYALIPDVLIWYEDVLLTQRRVHPTNALIYWRSGYKTPLYLATNLTCYRTAVKVYRRRMWIEEMFGDMKGHGFDLERSRLRHFLRLSRLTLVVALLYVWLLAVGEHVLVSQQAGDVDRTDRRDLSVFRLGWDFIERRLALDDPIPKTFVPNFCSVSGN